MHFSTLERDWLAVSSLHAIVTKLPPGLSQHKSDAEPTNSQQEGK